MQFIQYMYLNPKDVYHICLYACISSLPFSNWNQENKLERIKRFAPIFFYLFVVSLERICRKSENSIYMPISKNLTCSLQKITAKSNFEHQQRINVGFLVKPASNFRGFVLIWGAICRVFTIRNATFKSYKEWR